MAPTASTFALESPKRPGAQPHWFPHNLLGFEVATPLEAVVTIIAIVEQHDGKKLRVPMAWSPSTGIVRRMHVSTWEELGITEHVSHIRNAVHRIARATHKKAVLKYTTIDMFDDHTE